MSNEFNGNGTMCGCGSGGSGGEPADYEDLKNQVATNTAAISEIQETIQSMSGGDECYYIPINANEALMLKGANYIDTGFKLNGNATLFVVGSLPDTTKQAVLVGAYKDNTQRTVLKILGKSHKIQSQWAGNVETTEEQTAEMDFSRRIDYTQTHANTRFYCSGKSVVLNNTGFTGTDNEVPLLLFNQSVTSTTVNNAALHSVSVSEFANGSANGYETLFIGARKYKKSDGSFVGYTFIQLWGGALFVRELPLLDGAYFELYEMQQ